MNNINLLPRKPRSEQYFWPVLSVTALAVVLSFTTLAVFQYKLEMASEQQAQYKQQLQARIQVLTRQHAEEPRTEEYRRLLQTVKSLEGKRIDWLPWMKSITAPLPEASRLLTLKKADASQNEVPVAPPASGQPQLQQPGGIIDSQKLDAQLEFSDFKQIADYVLKLKKDKGFQDIQILSVEKKELVLPVAVALVTESTPDKKPAVPAQKERFVQDIISQKPAVSGTKSEQLLSELDWLISGKMYEQEHGIKLPDRKFTSGSPLKDSPITEDELQKAREQVNKFESMFTENRETPATVQEAVAQATAAEKKAVVYTVHLEIQTRPITTTP
ncbi:hypothetical protein WMW72_11870 [Paenibacillus filicis]|uniref:Uncharacterized protein n=1 Tax=Paenibacillus filicis TaxID=669464 RepID=A0ABU9DI99_9BACL